MNSPQSSGGSDRLRRRTNMIERQAEAWRPPLLSAAGPGLQAGAALRRLLDLQFGSIWNDLAAELPLASGTLLDVGCGAQPYRPLVPQEVKYIAIDTADAKANFGYEMPDTLYFAGDVWPVADGSVDVVLCTETLEHVPDSRRFLAEAARCLRPGGRILLTVPFAARWHFIPHDYWRFTPSSLQSLLTGVGFDGIAVYARGNAGTVACYKAIALILPLLMPQGRGPLTGWALRLLGLLFAPILVILAGIGQATLLGRGGDDCLGYTVLATMGAGEPRRAHPRPDEPALVTEPGRR